MKLSQQLHIITPSSWNRSFSVFGALNALDGHFHHAIFSKTNSEAFIAFLEHLLSIYSGKFIFLILDNASYQRRGKGLVAGTSTVHPVFVVANRRVLWASTVKDRLLNADDNSGIHS